MAVPGIGTADDLANLTGLSRQRINQMFADGIVFKDSGTRGRYLLAKSVRGILAFYKAGRGGKATQDAGDLDPAQERARLDQLKQVEAGLRIKQAKKELVESADVEQLYADMVRIVVRNLETLPDRLERDTGLTGDQVQAVQDSVDAARDALHAELQKVVAND